MKEKNPSSCHQGNPDTCTKECHGQNAQSAFQELEHLHPTMVILVDGSRIPTDRSIQEVIKGLREDGGIVMNLPSRGHRLSWIPASSILRVDQL